MKVKVSDYIAEYLAEHGISTVFTVVGGGAMHLNDSIGHNNDLECIYNHHEQASAMAAESYCRVNNKMACCCVTSGPGAINALNGVAGAYQDSIPMIVISGQTKTSLMTVNSGLPLRTLGNQEFDIMSALSKVAKYYQTVMDKNDIKYCLEKAFFLATNGRPGPCWLEIPVDIQGSYIETDELIGYDSKERLKDGAEIDDNNAINAKIFAVADLLLQAQRPVFYIGNGVRISGGVEKLKKLSDDTKIPVVTCWDSIDVIETDNQSYVGRAGIMGDRAGNFAVQNSDLVIAIGNRLNIYQVGYQPDTWARAAKIVMVDIDRLELEKKTIRVDIPICMDASDFVDRLSHHLGESVNLIKRNIADWSAQGQKWKKEYPVVCEKHFKDESPMNVYALIDCFSRSLPQDMITVVANGSASVVGSAAYYIGNGQRFIMNCGISSMGYDLPAAIGACVAAGRKSITAIAGDGSIMMNLQELQTIVTNKLPIKILLINNAGYQQIRLTQTNLFQKQFVGIGPQSGDLGFPDFEKLSGAFGIPYYHCDKLSNLKDCIENFMKEDSFAIMEASVTTEQAFEPKSATKRREDGSLVSPPLEDLAPFLDRKELEDNMYIPLLNE